MKIAPIERMVEHLVALDCVVAPGSSGAPVVDDTMAVRGFIVAGSMDPDNPLSLAYPSEYWAAVLGSRPGRRSKRTLRKR